MTSQQGDAAPPVHLSRRGAAAIAVLQRPERRNAISGSMRDALADWYPQIARDANIYAAVLRSSVSHIFSVGGDIRELLALVASDAAAARAAVGAECRLCWLAECFSKPTVSLIDGRVMGTGAGLSLYGTHRVAGESYLFSMPETAIGFFPDCGLAHAFARMAPGVGSYLGLTGAELGPSDALALGLATHIIPRAEHEAIVAHLADADPVDPVLDNRHRQPLEQGPVMGSLTRIQRYFDAPDVADILARLEGASDADQPWARDVAQRLRARSPLALCLTFRAIQEAARLDIRETLIQDYRIAARLLGSDDFREGVTSAVIERGRKPRWQHGCVEDVPAALVEEHLTPPTGGDLDLRSRSEMQTARS
ncbi:MAG: enoyl-CoA hydratase/isomerase family protein [Hyphomicrobiaceae bacterium]